MLGHKLNLRLFLEGIEVPVIGAALTIVENSATAAQIQVIATDNVLKLLPRTVVHLFFYDYANPQHNQDPNISKAEQELANYKLLFMGEVQGVAFEKTPTSRVAVLNCVDFSNYWDTIYQYNFMGSLIGGHWIANFIGANTNLLTSPLGHGEGTIARLLMRPPRSMPKLKGLLGGIVSCLEAIGGWYYGKTMIRGVTDFASIAELRLKLMQQITAAEGDTQTQRFFATKIFYRWLNQTIGGLGRLVTFRSVIDILTRFIFHSVFPNPVAMYIPPATTVKKKTYTQLLKNNPKYTPVFESYEAIIGLIDEAAKQIRGGQLNEGAIAVQKAASELEKTIALASSLASGSDRKALVLPAEKAAQYLRSAKNDIETRYFGWASNAPGGERDVGARSVVLVLDKLEMARRTLASALNASVRKQAIERKEQYARVNNQIFRPDIWFASPPRCNVLFPEHYSSIAWQRNFLREVSRLELQVTHELLGDDALLNARYYAPNIADMRSGLRLSQARFKRMVMQHELYTGIIPMFEKMDRLNLYAMSTKSTNFKGAKVGYGQRAVNHQYFKYRFGSRGMSVAGRFNPWFVAGFPALVIDRPMDAASLVISSLPIPEQLAALGLNIDDPSKITQSALLAKLTPTQYLGVCAQLAHNIGQTGGTTQYTFVEARIHRETAELLGTDQKVVNKKVGKAKRRYVCAAEEAPFQNSTGRYGGRIIGVKDVSKQYKGRRLPRVGSWRERVVVDGVSINAYEVIESFDHRVKVVIDLPFEEVVRPEWIWDGWTNSKIGKTYEQFFGTGALTDVEAYKLSSEAQQSAAFTQQQIYKRLTDVQRPQFRSGVGLLRGKNLKKPKGQETVYNSPISGMLNPPAMLSETQDPHARLLDRTLDDPTFAMLEEANRQASAVLRLQEGVTIEAAVDYLVKVYSTVKHYNLNVGQFLLDYCWRPVATAVDILGTPDLTIEEVPPGSGKFVATKGTEGFHSRAFGDVSNLFGLVTPEIKTVLGLKAKEDYAKVVRLDVRAQRRQAVRDYVNELTHSRGLLG